METKTYVWIGVAIGGTVGGWLGSLMDHGNILGPWSIVFSAIGGLVGIWAGYKLGNQ